MEVGSEADMARRASLRAQAQELEGELKRYVETRAADRETWEKGLNEDQRKRLRPEVRSALEPPPEKRSDKQLLSLADVYLKDDSEYRQRKTAIDRLRRSEPRFQTTMVMAERREPRESYIFIKGDFTRKGEAVTPGVPEVLPPLPPEEKPTRLDLARWIVSPQNPLPARVMVNRIWQQYFGKGLVETENDFGTQGAAPSHPELLDWLATEFLRQHWSLKAMHRLIVTSATYRQSSRARPELESVDPNNKLLARQARLRLDAEIVRDVALSAGGLLSDKIGGPSVFPSMPDGVMTLGQSRREWRISPGTDRYRRGVYTYFWRATPHPGLMVFDAPDANSACTRRIRSNTPLQALTLLNDAGFFELAVGLAGRVLREGPPNPSDRLDYAFRLCLSRPPALDEKQRLGELLDQQLANQDANAASSNEPGSTDSSGLQLSRDLPAWTAVARVLLNLDETITRE
jgi:hypothetical protein